MGDVVVARDEGVAAEPQITAPEPAPSTPAVDMPSLMLLQTRGGERHIHAVLVVTGEVAVPLVEAAALVRVEDALASLATRESSLVRLEVSHDEVSCWH